ncbi:hypothetical protein PR048_003744 [Dryococelus australis]|uniref:Uncharacterized protein n=1 Tax=Dryococelus australis TaxID=614101 RepID=A0ABQ9IP00_9NEOP|nr:hypothetical protein PR048_003744 [Dryococelus australis]
MEQCWSAGEAGVPRESPSSTIPTCEDAGVSPPGIESGSPWWEASALATAGAAPERKVRGETGGPREKPTCRAASSCTIPTAEIRERTRRESSHVRLGGGREFDYFRPCADLEYYLPLWGLGNHFGRFSDFDICRAVLGVVSERIVPITAHCAKRELGESNIYTTGVMVGQYTQALAYVHEWFCLWGCMSCESNTYMSGVLVGEIPLGSLHVNARVVRFGLYLHWWGQYPWALWMLGGKYTTCIRVDAKQGFQNVSFYCEQPIQRAPWRHSSLVSLYATITILNIIKLSAHEGGAAVVQWSDSSPLVEAVRVRFSVYVVIVPDDAAGQRVFSGISHFPRPCNPVLLHTHLASPPSAIKTRIAGMQCHAGETGDPREETRRPATSSDTIPTCESSATRPGIEPGSPWSEAGGLTARPTPSPFHERERERDKER